MLIGSGDLLEVSVYGAPDYVKEVRVNSQGEVTLPLAGPVKIGGMSTEQAEAVIAKTLSAGASSETRKFRCWRRSFHPGISVLGEVTKPGIYPLREAAACSMLFRLRAALPREPEASYRSPTGAIRNTRQP